VNEPGLYSLILGSRKPEAKRRLLDAGNRSRPQKVLTRGTPRLPVLFLKGGGSPDVPKAPHKCTDQ
jgi:hypothetical protein